MLSKRAASLLVLLTIGLLGQMLLPLAVAQNGGNFVAGINYPAGPPTIPTNTGYWLGGVSPVEIHTGYFNAVGKFGLVTAASCAYSSFPACPLNGSLIVVYLSNGDGTFSAPIVSSGNLPPELRSIAVGDFDGDGNLDVAAAADCLSSQDCSSGTITIFHGNGDGTFTQVSQYPLTGIVGQAATVAVGDFNGNGKLDLAVGIECYNIPVNGCSVGALSIYLGNGDGTLASPTPYYTAGNSALLPVVGPFNVIHNNNLDVIAASGSSLTVLLGNGDGTFSQSVTALPFSSLVAITAGDVNSDGKQDLVLSQYYGSIQVLIGYGDGSFQSATAVNTGISYLSDSQVIDMNNDGKPDIVVSGASGTQVLLNNGMGNFVPGSVYGLTGSGGYGLLVTQDFNGDGNADILIGTPSNGNAEGTLSVLLGNGDGTMQGVTILSQTLGTEYGAISADVNGDGIPDLLESVSVANNANQGGILVFLGTGNGQYAAPVLYTAGYTTGTSLVAGDFNKDGKLDIAVLGECLDDSCSQGGVTVLLGNGDGTFQPPASYGTGGQYSRSLVIGDFNGDGQLDIASANQASSIGILLGNGDGTFQQPAAVTSAGSINFSIAAADFNNDGKTDIALNYYDPVANGSFVQVLLSGVNGTLSPQGPPYSSGGNGEDGALAIADVDRDNNGNLDIVIANQCQSADTGCAFGSLATLLGNGDGTFRSGPIQTVPDGKYYSLFLADVNGDGMLDAVASDPTGIEVLLGKDDGSFLPPVAYVGLQNAGQSTTLALADLNIIQPGAGIDLTAVFISRAGTYLVSKSSPNPSTGSQAVQLTTTASASYLTGIEPTGSISYYEGTTLLGSAAFVGGVASFNITTGLSQGVHTITPYYSGDSNFNAHYGTPLLQVVMSVGGTSPTQTSISSPTITYGTNGAATVTVTSTSGTVAGNVLLTVDSGAPQTMSLVSGMATFAIPTPTGGTHSLSASYAAQGTFAASAATGTLQVNQATPTVTFIGAPTTAPYLATFTVTAVTNASTTAVITASGACAVTSSTGTGSTITMTSGTGACTLLANWAADNNYLAASASQSTTATKIAPTVAFTGAPTTAPYEGTFTVAATTNASTTPLITVSGPCSIAGATVTISAPSGTCSLSATWAADNNYLAASANQSTTATKATPTIEWTTPAAITYGTSLSGTQLDAKATYNGAAVAGSFVYTPAKGTVLTAGIQTLSVTFTPTKTADYASTGASVTLQVNQATPKISWARPAAITYGIALSSMQLDATASVAGGFVYSPAAGTVLEAGGQTLSVIFTPTNATDYTAATQTVTLTVDKSSSATAITANTPDPSLVNQAVTVTFAVAGGGVGPTGNVGVSASTGETCSGSITAGAGSCSLTFATARSRTLTAKYSGDTNFKSSTSATVTQTVHK